jgi:ureidoacrylate peracid hydrolase
MNKIKYTETALLMIDIQNGFYHSESQMGKSIGVDDRQKNIPVFECLIKFARSHQIPIFWSKQIHFESDLTRKNKKLRNHMQKQKFTPCLRGTFEIELYDKIKHLCQSEDFIIEKHRASLFYDTNLSTKLKMLGIRNLIIAGCNTEFCVAHTIRDAYARDFEMIVVQDAVAGIDSKMHENCLEVFQAYFAEVIPFEKIDGFFE